MTVMPSIAVADWITFAGEPSQVISFENVRNRQEMALRLRSKDGRDRLALLSAVYADLTAQASGLPAPTIAELEGLAFADDSDDEDPVDYLGKPFPPEDVAVPADGEPTAKKALLESSGPRFHQAAMLEVLPENAREKALEREAHLLEAISGFRSGDEDAALPGEPRPEYDPDASTLTERLEIKGTEMGVSRATIWRYYDAYVKDQLWGCVDKRAQRGVNPLTGMSDLLIEAILDQADAEGDASHAEWPRFWRRLNRRVQSIPKYKSLRMPPESTVRPKIEAMLAARLTFGSANRKRSRALKPTKQHVLMKANRPGQVVLCDSCKLDARIYDPIQDCNVKAVLAWAMDVCTRAILAWVLVPESDSRVDAISLLAGMLRPEPMRPHWREDLSIRRLGLPMHALLAHDARFEGAAALPVIYPETIVIDHGKVYVSDDFKRACRKLGITIQNARKIAPTDKAQIERSFKTLNSRFTQHLAGYTGSNPTERGRHSEEQARWTGYDVEEFLAEYIVAVHQRTPHAGLPYPSDPTRCMSPNEAYMAAVTRAGWVAAPISDTLYYELLPTRWLKIHPYGVNVDRRVHDDAILVAYRHKPSPYPPPITAHGKRNGYKKGQRKRGNLVPIQVDPRDLTHVYFYAWEHKRWYGLRWTMAGDRMEPFSETFYRHTRKVIRMRGGDHEDQAEIAATLLALQEQMDAPETWLSTSKRQRSVMAERARAAARDRARSIPLANEEPNQDPQPHSRAATGTDTAKKRKGTRPAKRDSFDIDVASIAALPIDDMEAAA